MTNEPPRRPGLADAVRDYVSAKPVLDSTRLPADRPRPAGSADLASALADVGTHFGRPVQPSAPSSTAPAAPAPGPTQLAAAVEQFVEYEAAKPKYTGPIEARWKRGIAPVAAGVMIAAAAWLTLAKPAWLYPPIKPSSIGDGAKAKEYLIATSFLLDQYRASHGRLASNPAELGFPVQGLFIIDQGNGAYQLRTDQPRPGFFLDGNPSGEHRFGEVAP